MTDDERAMLSEINTWRERFDAAHQRATALEAERVALLHRVYRVRPDEQGEGGESWAEFGTERDQMCIGLELALATERAAREKAERERDAHAATLTRILQGRDHAADRSLLADWRDSVIARAAACGMADGQGLCTWFEGLYSRAEAAEARAAKAEAQRDELVLAIRRGALASIGAWNTHYVPQVSREWLDKLLEESA